MSGEPVGLECPGCKELPYAVLGGTQAFCGSPDCRIITWDPTMTMDELLEEVHRVDLSGWGL